jgi:hypothetical protein
MHRSDQLLHSFDYQPVEETSLPKAITLARVEPEPDTKDWTWTLTRRCPDCGLEAGTVDPTDIPDRAFVAAEEWIQILRSSPAVTSRPFPDVWSPLEYGAHVRDMFRVFDGRLTQMLAEDDPIFENWDQNDAAVRARYREQDPEVVADELEAAAEAFVARLASVEPAQLGRPGKRSDGSDFTVGSLSQYFLHDVVHHLWDVTGQQDAVSSLSVERSPAD